MGQSSTGPQLTAAVVSDTAESYLVGAIQPLSITTEGRLRTSVVEAHTYMNLFDSGLGSNPGTDPFSIELTLPNPPL